MDRDSFGNLFLLDFKILRVLDFYLEILHTEDKDGMVGVLFPSKFLPYNPYFLDEIAKVQRLARASKFPSRLWSSTFIFFYGQLIKLVHSILWYL